MLGEGAGLIRPGYSASEFSSVVVKGFAGHQNASQVMWLEFLMEDGRCLIVLKFPSSKSWI